MKIGTALKTMIVFLFLLFPFSFFAEELNVNVTVSINTDIHSYITLVPATSEISAPSQVQISMVDGNGNPKVGRKTYIYVKGSNADKVTITQAPITNASGTATGNIYASTPGVYEVCIQDQTEVNVIEVEKCSNFYVIPTPPPVMEQEPAYTVGSTNTVSWTPQGSLPYQYYVEVSTNQDFTSVVNNSGWISTTSHTFSGLQGGQMYFYRVKAKNNYGSESTWSNYVYSAQSVASPAIILEKISPLPDTYSDSWNQDSVISFTYRINDKLGVDGVKFLCVNSDGSKKECNATISQEGNIYTVSIKLGDLEKQLDGTTLYPSYSFCLEATNSIGTKSSNCTATVNFSKKVVVDDTEEPLTPPTPSTPPPEVEEEPVTTTPLARIIAKVENVVKEFWGTLSTTVADSTPEEARDVAVTSLAVNVSVGLALLTSLITSMPYLITQIILGVLTFFGLRKKGNLNGYIYDSFSKNPVRQAIVRIYTKEDELIWTDVTNQQGYFKTIDIPNGEYYITVNANGYIFPTKTIFGSTDLPMENIYHGGVFTVTKNSIPKFSIPLDRAESKAFSILKQRSWNLLKLIFHLLHVTVFIIGLIFSIYAVSVSPILINYIILALYIPSILLIVFPLWINREKYGIVRDEKKNRLEGIDIGLYESEFNRLVLKRVTDSKGRYRFLADRGNYYISVLNPEYSIVNEKKFENIVVKKRTGEMIRPDITVRKNV